MYIDDKLEYICRSTGITFKPIDKGKYNLYYFKDTTIFYSIHEDELKNDFARAYSKLLYTLKKDPYKPIDDIEEEIVSFFKDDKSKKFIYSMMLRHIREAIDERMTHPGELFSFLYDFYSKIKDSKQEQQDYL